MRVLMTGISGRLSGTVQVLLDQGLDILAVDRRFPKDPPEGLEIRIVDLMNKERCYDLVQGVDAVLHMAAWPHAGTTDPQTLLRDNVTTTMNLIQAAKDLKVGKFVYTSSVQVIAGDRPEHRHADTTSPCGLPYLPVDSDTPARVYDEYGLSKLCCEQMLEMFARRHGLSCIALRLPAIVLKEWIRHYTWMLKNDRRSICLDEVFSCLTVQDCGRLFAAVLKTDLPGYRCYLPSCRKPLSIKSIPELIETYYPDIPLHQPIEELKSLVDISRITAETGWEPLDEILDMALAEAK